MLRICIPLDRVEVNGISDYHGFSTLVGLDVELENETQAPWHPDRIATGDSSGLLDTRGRGKHPGSG
jgi:sterol 3beta-glucosyltransferase